MGRLTTHVLDTARGKPAEGLTVELYTIDAARTLVKAAVANDAGAYFAALGTPSSFLSQLPIRFHLFEDSHFHVPLLLSPYGYSTYRGS